MTGGKCVKYLQDIVIYLAFTTTLLDDSLQLLTCLKWLLN